MQVDKWEFIFSLGVKSTSFFFPLHTNVLHIYHRVSFLSLILVVDIRLTRIFVNAEILPPCSHRQFLLTLVKECFCLLGIFEPYQFHGKKKKRFCSFSYCHL